MAVAASAGSSPRFDRMRTAPAWMLMPTPRGLSSPMASYTSTSKSARLRHIAAVSPPMPAPATTIFIGSGIAAQTAEQERGLIVGPALVVGVAELAQVGPAVDAGIVLVVKHDADGIVADGLDGDDLHVPAAGHDLLGRRPAMPHHLGRRALDPQVLGRQVHPLAVGEIDLDPAFGLEHAQLLGPRRIGRFVMALVRYRLRDVAAHQTSFSCRASLTSMMGMPSRIG